MKFLSKDYEPLRRYLYGILGPALALLGLYGILDAKQVVAFAALGGAALVIPAVELARAKLDSPVTQAVKRDDAVVIMADAVRQALDAENENGDPELIRAVLSLPGDDGASPDVT